MDAFRYTRPSRTKPQHIELMPRFEDLGAHPQKNSFADVWARANVLAFSCEAANAMVECSQNVARLRPLQRRVRPSLSYEL